MANPVTDPDIIAQLEGGPKPVTDPAILAQLNGTTEKPVLQRVQEAIHEPTRILQNASLLGLGDRARALMGTVIGEGRPTLSGLVTGDEGGYGGLLKKEQAQTRAYETAHPIAAPLIGAVGGAAVPIAALGAAGQGASLGTKALLGAGTGAAFGGAQGAASSPDWTNIGQTGKDAAVGAGIGGILGGALPIAGKAIGSGYNLLANALTGTEGISKGASRHLVEALSADTVPAAQQRVSALGPDAMLGDAGPALLGKLQGSVLNSDEGRSIGVNALTRRNEGTNQRIMGDVNRALGPAEDPQTVTNAIRDHRTAVDSVNYPAALDNAPAVKIAPIMTDLVDRIEQTPAGSMEHKALTNLQKMLTKTEKQPLLDVNGDQVYDKLGNERWHDVPSSHDDANILHKVKGELDNIIEYDAPGLGVPAGALQRQQGSLKQMRGAINDALETQVPGYAAANRKSAGLARRGTAVDLGTQYLGSGKTTASPGRFSDEFTKLEPGEQIAFAKGSRGNIERVLGTKANDLQALRGELQGEGGWNAAKIAAVHGQPASDELAASVDRNLKFRDTYNKVVENSQTAQRQAAARGMKPEPSSETPLLNPNMSLTGLAATGAKKAANALLNTMRPDPTKSFGEVARVLSAQGSERDRHLAALADTLLRRQGNAAAAPGIGNRTALAAALLGNGYVQSRPRQTQAQ
jgi:hypothetical protein